VLLVLIWAFRCSYIGKLHQVIFLVSFFLPLIPPSHLPLTASGGNELSAEAIEQHLVGLISTVSAELHAAGCIEVEDGEVDVSNAASVAGECELLFVMWKYLRSGNQFPNFLSFCAD